MLFIEPQKCFLCHKIHYETIHCETFDTPKGRTGRQQYERLEKKLTKARSKLAYLQTIGTLGANTPNTSVFHNCLQGNKLERNGRKSDKKVFSTTYH